MFSHLYAGHGGNIRFSHRTLAWPAHACIIAGPVSGGVGGNEFNRPGFGGRYGIHRNHASGQNSTDCYPGTNLFSGIKLG